MPKPKKPRAPLQRKANAPIVIDKHIPPSVERRGGQQQQKSFYPFAIMQPGDSFWVAEACANVRSALSKAKPQLKGFTFVTRSETQDGVPNSKVWGTVRGVRVWRIL